MVKKQRQIKENERYEGTERTTGDPFDNLEQTLGETKPYQLIQERPHKETTNSVGDSTDETETTLSVELGRSDVEQLLSGDVPEDLRRELVIQIVEQAFRSDG